MKLTGIILMTIYSAICLGQQDCSLQLREHTVEKIFWEVQDTSVMKKYWGNGKLKVSYEHLHDSIFIRNDFYESGYPMTIATVYQTFCKTTSYTENEKMEMVAEVDSGYCDILHGKYEEFGDYGQGNYTTGQFTRNTMIGEWTKRLYYSHMIVAKFDTAGNLNGEYFEYYYRVYNPKTNIRWQGQYEVETYHQTQDGIYVDGVQTPPKSVVVKKSVKAGVWKHFDEKGELLETVTYEWKKE